MSSTDSRRCYLSAVLAGSLLICSSSEVGAQTCPAANPNDQIRDDDQIQMCLNAGGTIVLDGNSGGYYIIRYTLVIPSGVTLTSVGTSRAMLFAHPDLVGPIIYSNSSGFTLSRLWLYGNMYNRTAFVGVCNSGSRGTQGDNASLNGSNFLIDDIESSFAMCGTGMGVNGTDFEIRNSWFANNGRSGSQAPGVQEPWADGLTVTDCYGGNIHAIISSTTPMWI